MSGSVAGAEIRRAVVAATAAGGGGGFARAAIGELAAAVHAGEAREHREEDDPCGEHAAALADRFEDVALYEAL